MRLWRGSRSDLEASIARRDRRSRFRCLAHVAGARGEGHSILALPVWHVPLGERLAPSGPRPSYSEVTDSSPAAAVLTSAIRRSDDRSIVSFRAVWARRSAARGTGDERPCDRGRHRRCGRARNRAGWRCCGGTWTQRRRRPLVRSAFEATATPRSTRRECVRISARRRSELHEFDATFSARQAEYALARDDRERERCTCTPPRARGACGSACVDLSTGARRRRERRASGGRAFSGDVPGAGDVRHHLPSSAWTHDLTPSDPSDRRSSKCPPFRVGACRPKRGCWTPVRATRPRSQRRSICLPGVFEPAIALRMMDGRVDGVSGRPRRVSRRGAVRRDE